MTTVFIPKYALEETGWVSSAAFSGCGYPPDDRRNCIQKSVCLAAENHSLPGEKEKSFSLNRHILGKIWANSAHPMNEGL